MPESVQHFVERMGLLIEEDGMPRIAGRLFGFLLVHQGVFSLDDLAEQLQVSKASVSTNARLLEQVGMIERTCASGDRRDFYQVGDHPWERFLRTGTVRWRRMERLMAESAKTLPDEYAAGRDCLREAERFHVLLLDGIESLLQRWSEQRAKEEQKTP